MYKLEALYIINIKIRLTNKKSTSTINAYINIKMTKKARIPPPPQKKGKKKQSTVNAYIDINDDRF